MKSDLLIAASALALVLGLASIILLLEMYEVKPNTWGPQGVEFGEWHKVWAARRDLYVWLGIGSFLAAPALLVAALFQHRRRLTRG